MRDIIRYPITTEEIITTLEGYLAKEVEKFNNLDPPIGNMTALILQEAIKRIKGEGNG